MANKRYDNKRRLLKTGESQRTDGRYMYRFKDRRGKRQTIYAADLAELREKERQIEIEQSQGVDYNNITLNDWFDEYMQMYKADTLAVTTLNRYNGYYNNYLRTSLGLKRLKDIKRIDILKLYSGYLTSADKPLKIGTIKNINTILIQLMEQAVKNDIILKNPCTGIIKELHAPKPEPKQALTTEQQNTFLKAVRGNKIYSIYEPIFITALCTGMRIGELLGLTWEDIDFKKGFISVNKTLHYEKIDGEFKFFYTKPKTKNSVRTIPITEETRVALKKQRFVQLAHTKRCNVIIDGYQNFIFTTAKGYPYASANIKRIISRICEEHNKNCDNTMELLPHISPHTFRHTYCTRLCENDINIKVIQNIMGHTDIKTTMDIYTHVTESRKADELKKVDFKIS